MRLKILYYLDGIKEKTIDSEHWLYDAPNDILMIIYEVNGVKQECYGFGAYFVIDDFIGGFNTITGFNGDKKKYFPCETFIMDSRVRMGRELSDEEWSKVRSMI